MANGQISNFGLMTLTLDRVILHTVAHHSLTSTYMQNFIEIKKRFMNGQTYARMYGCTFETGLLGRLCRRVDLKKEKG